MQKKDPENRYSQPAVTWRFWKGTQSVLGNLFAEN